MAELDRPDGTRIHYEVRGDDGPALVLASYWSWVPGVYDELLSDLASDHRIVTYHLRGTGESSRDGPYDMETDSADLEALVEAVEGPAILLGTADSSNRSAKVAARRPELVGATVSIGTAPISRAAFEGHEGMLASDSVIEGLIELFQHNYRGGVRTMAEATNSQMSEDELRERVDLQVEFCPADAAQGRLNAWADDDPRAESRAIGERLWILAATDVGGPWLPPAEVLAKLTDEMLPEAQVIEVDPGPITRPDIAAGAIRRIAATLLAGEPEGRK